jgi:MOSC domain-containing protein YiiM
MPALAASTDSALDLRALTARQARPGRLEAIWLRPARGVPAVAAAEVLAIEGRGLQGDRKATAQPRPGGAGHAREVTLIQAEHLVAMGTLLGLPGPLDAARARRSLVVSGLNLIAARSPFKDRPLQLALGDDVLLIVTGPCEPCRMFELEFGPGAYNAARGHAGMTASIVRGGRLMVGDAVRLVEPGAEG